MESGQKMNVLMISTEKLPVPPIKGGAIQTYIHGVTPFLTEKLDLTIMGIADPSLPKEEQDKNLRYIRLPGKENFALYQKNIVAFLQKNQFDIIHIFNRPRLVRPIREVAPTARIFLSLHNEMFHPNKLPAKEGAYAIEQVERILTVSNYIGKTVCQLYPAAENKVKTVYSGVDLKQFPPHYAEASRVARAEIRKKHNLHGKKVILYVGRLSPKKGADVLIRAMPEVAKKHPDAALVLVGSHWYSQNRISDYVAYVRSLASRCPIPVLSTGFVAPDQVPKWFLAADLFVCPSQWQEPLARVHYEAMAAGLPIITTQRGGNAEVIQGNGYAVEQADNPKALAKKIILLLSDKKLRQQFGKRSRELAEKHYSWQRVAGDILEIWQK